jgi:hypothetical protein
MIHSQNHRVVGDVPAAAIGATATATLTIDTLGYDHASISVLRASNASTVFANAIKIEESDDSTASYSNVTAFVGGGTGGFTIPGIAAAATGSASILKLDVDTKAKKRYLKVSYTPGASATVAIVARLGRGEVSPETAAQAGVIGQVRG